MVADHSERARRRGTSVPSSADRPNWAVLAMGLPRALAASLVQNSPRCHSSSSHSNNRPPVASRSSSLPLSCLRLLAILFPSVAGLAAEALQALRR